MLSLVGMKLASRLEFSQQCVRSPRKTSPRPWSRALRGSGRASRSLPNWSSHPYWGRLRRRVRGLEHDL